MQCRERQIFEPQKQAAAEELLLKYYNRILLETGLIREQEHRCMLQKIDAHIFRKHRIF